MKLLIDTNIVLEVILEQDKGEEVRALLSKTDEHEFFISDYALHSIGLFSFVGSSTMFFDNSCTTC